MRLVIPDVTTCSEKDLRTRLADDWDRADRADHAWLAANMVTSIDGAATIAGRSGGLGSPTDRLIFHTLRDLADVIVVGAETVRAEGYHLVRAPHPDSAARREAAGQAERARLCIVTRSGRLGTPPFLDELPTTSAADAAHSASWQRPIIATTGAAAERAEQLRDPRLDVWPVDDRRAPDARHELGVDLSALIDRLVAHGMRRILCEGGPTLLAQLAAIGRVDEWNFTVAPVVAGGLAIRPVRSIDDLGTALRLDRLIEDDSFLFTRYLAADTAG